MSIESDAASQVASIYAKGIEEAAHIAIKISGEVFQISKQLLELLVVKGIWKGIVNQDYNQSGKVRLANLLRKAAEKQQPIHILDIKDQAEFDKVSKELANSGVLFAKTNGDTFDIVFTEDYAPLVNRAIDNLGLNSVGKDTKSEVTKQTEPKNKSDNQEHDEISIDDDDLNKADSLEDYEKSVSQKVNLTKDESNKSKDTDNKQADKPTQKTEQEYEDPYSQVPDDYYEQAAPPLIDLDEIEEVDPVTLMNEIQKAEKKEQESPLEMDGEAAAPSKKKSAAEKSSDNKPSIHQKLAEKKADRAEKAAAAKETLDKAKGNVDKTVSLVKEAGGK